MTQALIFMAIGAALTLAVILVARRLTGFHAQRPDDYAAQSPAFDIRAQLDGPILCEGVIYGPTGRVASRFVADMQASWDGDRGHMTEDFTYDNGTKQARAWDLTVLSDGTIRAEAEDIVGTGRGVQKGAGVMLRYRLRLPEASGGHVLDVTDWMYLMQNGTIINRSQFRKFGVTVAELVATMRPADAEQARSLAAE